jgi:excisionase family DNA binding protein
MNELVSIKEMAAMLHISEKTFRRAIKEQNLPFYRIGNTKRFNPSKVLARIEAVEEVSESPKRKVNKQFPHQKNDYAEYYELLELK